MDVFARDCLDAGFLDPDLEEARRDLVLLAPEDPRDEDFRLGDRRLDAFEVREDVLINGDGFVELAFFFQLFGPSFQFRYFRHAASIVNLVLPGSNTIPNCTVAPS